MNPMQKWKNVNLPLTFNIISMKTGSLPWHSPLTKQRILLVIVRGNSSFNSESKKDREARQRGGEWRG